jgi:hypothetical protein
MGTRHDQERDRVGGLVHELMLGSGRNLESLPRPERKSRAIDFEDRFTVKDIEELARRGMEVAALVVSRWHALLDDAQVGTIEQMPAQARGAPPVLFTRMDIDDLWQERLSYMLRQPAAANGFLVGGIYFGYQCDQCVLG